MCPASWSICLLNHSASQILCTYTGGLAHDQQLKLHIACVHEINLPDVQVFYTGKKPVKKHCFSCDRFHVYSHALQASNCGWRQTFEIIKTSWPQVPRGWRKTMSRCPLAFFFFLFSKDFQFWILKLWILSWFWKKQNRLVPPWHCVTGAFPIQTSMCAWFSSMYLYRSALYTRIEC